MLIAGMRMKGSGCLRLIRAVLAMMPGMLRMPRGGGWQPGRALQVGMSECQAHIPRHQPRQKREHREEAPCAGTAPLSVVAGKPYQHTW